jgi:hypothetical protein
MEVSFTEEQWAEVDTCILRRGILPAILAIRRFAGVGIKDAIDVHIERYRKLRTERPAEFSCSDEDYWRDVYS